MDAADYLVKVAEDENSTYLEKCAGIADAFAAGAVTGEEGDEIANELGVSPEDVANVFSAVYGDIEKTASEAEMNATDYLVKVAEDENSTYLEKCAGVADAYMADAITSEEAQAISAELGLSTGDVDNVIEAAYGDVLEKEAGAVKDGVKKAGDFVKNVTGYENLKRGVLGRKGAKDYENYGNASKAAKKKAEDTAKTMKSGANKELAIGAAKAAGTTAVVGGSGYGASKLFGKKDND